MAEHETGPIPRQQEAIPLPPCQELIAPEPAAGLNCPNCGSSLALSVTTASHPERYAPSSWSEPGELTDSCTVQP